MCIISLEPLPKKMEFWSTVKIEIKRFIELTEEEKQRIIDRVCKVNDRRRNLTHRSKCDDYTPANENMVHGT